MPNMVECYKCHQLKEEKEFYKDRTKKRGFTSYCIDCISDITDNYVPTKVVKDISCPTCFGYGMFYWDRKPISQLERKAEYRSVPCPKCGSDWSKGKEFEYRKHQVQIRVSISSGVNP